MYCINLFIYLFQLLKFRKFPIHETLMHFRLGLCFSLCVSVLPACRPAHHCRPGAQEKVLDSLELWFVTVSTAMHVVRVEPESYRTARALNHWTFCAATSFVLNISNSNYKHCCGNYFTTFKLSSENLCQTIFKAKWPFEGGTYFLYFPSGDYNFC